MPELPEVYKVSHVLNERVKNKKIKKIEVLYSKVISDDYNILINQSINGVRRIGKYIIFDLDDYYLISHMRMEGRYYTGNNLCLKHNLLNIYLDDMVIYYQDFRKFGRFKILAKDLDLSEALNIGRDALEIDESYLKEKLNVNRPIKSVLLDQKIIAGIGNIYADEICFIAGINPKRIATSIKSYEKLAEAINQVLNKFIVAGLASIDNKEYISWEFDLDTNVHFKKICKKCHNEIKKIKINQRTTYYCDICQGNI